MKTIKIDDAYLGDGVYASYNGYYITLDLRGQSGVIEIALEPSALDALDFFRKRIHELEDE